jgi:hypothetical protein
LLTAWVNKEMTNSSVGRVRRWPDDGASQWLRWSRLTTIPWKSLFAGPIFTVRDGYGRTPFVQHAMYVRWIWKRVSLSLYDNHSCDAPQLGNLRDEKAVDDRWWGWLPATTDSKVVMEKSPHWSLVLLKRFLDGKVRRWYRFKSFLITERKCGF